MTSRALPRCDGVCALLIGREKEDVRRRHCRQWDPVYTLHPALGVHALNWRKAELRGHSWN